MSEEDKEQLETKEQMDQLDPQDLREPWVMQVTVEVPDQQESKEYKDQLEM